MRLCHFAALAATALLARSDFTLAVITEITICLDPSRVRRSVALAHFPVAYRSAECRAWLARLSRIRVDAGPMDSRVCDDPISTPALLRAVTQSCVAPRTSYELVSTNGAPIGRDLVAPEGWPG